MEQPKHHEIIRPIREIVHGIGNFVLDKILPVDALTDLFNGVEQESAIRTAQMFTQEQFQYDSEGNWHNPDGQTVPSVDGRDL